MNALLVGYGEVGRGVYECLSRFHDISIHDKDKGKVIDSGNFDVLLVAIPYSEDFVDIVKEYTDKFNIFDVIVFSTVKIGTCSRINRCVHSPVEGRHPDIGKSISKMKRFVGGISDTVVAFFALTGLDVVYLDKPEYTEFLKLRSTTLYGVNIEFARYSKEVADDIGMDFEYIKEFDLEYNKLYKGLGLDNFSRYILDAPKGKIGGHCVVPNAKLLDEQYPNLIVKRVYENS